MLAATDPTSLSDQGLVDFTKAAERQLAHATAISLAAIRTLAQRAATTDTTPPRSTRTQAGTLDQLRSQVFFDLLQRAVTDPGFPTQHGKRRIETQIVIWG